jgi:DNA-binding response OmpR family regulator
LIVEDDADLRALYRQVLMISGYAVVAVEDGIDALRRIESDPPDLVILDIELPRLSGRDVQSELAAHAATRNIPIVVVTGSDTRALDPRGFYCILRKPVTPESLVAVVDDCLRAAQRRPGPATAQGQGDRRRALYCPFCTDQSVRRETRATGRVASQMWTCAACHASWPERRKAS